MLSVHESLQQSNGITMDTFGTRCIVIIRILEFSMVQSVSELMQRNYLGASANMFAVS